jgi:hypothetical protein
MVKPTLAQKKDNRANSKGQVHSALIRAIDTSTVVDEENGILRNVLLCQSMQPKGAAGFVDNVWNENAQDFTRIPVVTPQSFIEKLVELSANFREKGQKARFGHPAMCEQEAGNHCGWIKNIRVEGDGVVGDIQLADFADLSPKGSLKSYVLAAAKEDPEALMMSIVFSPGGYYFEEKGQQIEYDWSEEHDNRIMALPESERVLFESVKAWHYTDFVGEGANTNNLFRSVNGEPMTAALVTDFLDSNPEIFEILTKSPEIMKGFLQKYEAHKARTLSKQQVKMNKPMTWKQRTAAFLSGMAERLVQGEVTIRNIDATTSEGANITIMTTEDLPAVGDIVQLTDTGEIPPAAVHTIAGGDLDGYQITTDEAGTITEVVEPVAAVSEETAAAPVAEDAIRKMIAEEVAKAVAPLATQLKSVSTDFQSFKTNPLVKKAGEARVQVQTPTTREADMPAWEKEMIAKSEKFAGKKREA